MQKNIPADIRRKKTSITGMHCSVWLYDDEFIDGQKHHVLCEFSNELTSQFMILPTVPSLLSDAFI
jgi:hypothetical protein